MLLRRQVCELTLHVVLEQRDATLAQRSDTWRSRRNELLQMPRWRPMNVRTHEMNDRRRLTAASRRVTTCRRTLAHRGCSPCRSCYRNTREQARPRKRKRQSQRRRSNPSFTKPCTYHLNTTEEAEAARRARDPGRKAEHPRVNRREDQDESATTSLKRRELLGGHRLEGLVVLVLRVLLQVPVHRELCSAALERPMK